MIIADGFMPRVVIKLTSSLFFAWVEHCVSSPCNPPSIKQDFSLGRARSRSDRTCGAHHRRTVVARCSIHSRLQLLAPAVSLRQKQLVIVFTLLPENRRFDWAADFGLNNRVRTRGLYHPKCGQNLNLWSLPSMSNGHKFFFCHIICVILTRFGIA